MSDLVGVMTDGYPEVPESTLTEGGWELQTRTEETVFRTPTSSIIGKTVLYGDARLRAALDSVGAGDLLRTDDTDSDNRLIDTDDGDTFWRFFFATALTFRPPLAPGIGPASMRPMVVSEARKSFENDLEARGFTDVERGRTQRVRTDSGDRASLVKVTATYPLDVDDTDTPDTDQLDALDIEGWLAVWSTGGSFRIAGGAYPIRGLDTLLADCPEEERPETSPQRYRDDLLDLIRAVE